MVSRPTFSAVITKLPDWLSVPPMTLSPSDFVSGIDSPVTIDSSIALRPSMIVPSTGTLSPGRTRKVSPAFTSSRSTSVSTPSAETRRAFFGDRSRSARIAPLVCSRALSSRICPSRTKTVMTAAASKYTGTAPLAVRMEGGNRSGRKVATTL